MKPWYERSFANRYLDLYPDRDAGEAREDIGRLVELVEIDRRAPVLDLGCGAGRHLLSLLESGFTRAVGLDLSPELLRAAARGLDRATGGGALLVRADMRRIPFSGVFALVISMFTSFGYFTDDGDDAAVLVSVHGALRERGIFVLDYLNAERIRGELVPFDEVERGGMRIVHRRDLSGDGRRVEKRTVVTTAGGTVEEYVESVRLYSPDELGAMFGEAGFGDVRSYGSLAGEPFSRGSGRLVVAARKGETR